MVKNADDIFSKEEQMVLRLMRTMDKNVIQEYAIMVTGALFEENSNTPDDIRVLLEHAKKLNKKVSRAGQK